MTITETYQKIRSEIPPEVTIVVAAKQRSAQEISQIIDAGATDIGENYVQEAVAIKESLGEKAKCVNWHMIGDLQTNKINKALNTFDILQTIDSFHKAVAIDTRAQKLGADTIECLLEINIGEEKSKSGLILKDIDINDTIVEISKLPNIRLKGLMTMAPFFDDKENYRPYFKKMADLFYSICAMNIDEVDMSVLSMGMSDSYQIAIEEGATMVRIGTKLFGPRKY